MRHVRRILLICLVVMAGLPRGARSQAAAVDVASFSRPGERVVTVQPPMRYAGHEYTVHYFTTATTGRSDAWIFVGATPEYFQQQQITGFLVTVDGNRVVEDEEMLRRIFELYPAAYLLYTAKTLTNLGLVDDEFVNELRNITRSPFFAEQQIGALFTTRAEESAEAMRGLLVHRAKPADDIEEFGETLRKTVETSGSVIASVDETLEAARFSNNRQVRNAAKSVRDVFGQWKPVTDQVQSSVEVAGKQIEMFDALDFLELSVRLLWLSELQHDRAQWLNDYLDFAVDDAAFDGDQLTANGIVQAEARENWLRRGVIILQFVRDTAWNSSVRLGGKTLADMWVKWSWKTFGKRTTGHLVAGAASSVFLGFTVSSLIMGLDELYSNFKTGERSDELRRKFRAGRLQLSIQVSAMGDNTYDGDVAARYRAAYMLESLAAAQMYRTYADGVEATVREGWLAVINPIAWLRGEEWREAVRGLRSIAESVEQEAEETVGHPVFVDAAIGLVNERISLNPQPSPTLEMNDWVLTALGWSGEAQQWTIETWRQAKQATEQAWQDFWEKQTEAWKQQMEEATTRWAEEFDAWWRSFVADQQRRMEEEITRQLEEFTRQLCGAPVGAIFIGILVMLRKRKQ